MIAKPKRIKLTRTEWLKLRTKVEQRANSRCEICDKWLGYGEGAPHHIKSKGAGGDDTEVNLLWICVQCHQDIHDGRMNSKGEVIGGEESK